MTTIIYLAARYSRREELLGYRAALIGFPRFFVNARWLDGNHELELNGWSREAESSERERFALEDWADVTSADIVISFTETPRSTNGRGGRHVEFGAAMALGKRCVVVGPRENVFHHLPQVEWYATWDECLSDLAGQAFEANVVGMGRPQA